MSFRGLFLRALTLFGVLALAACAPVRVREDAGTQRLQGAREAQLAPLQDWSLEAHLGVSNGDDGGSGQLAWKQNGDAYDFSVRAPVTGKTWHLHGDARTATLEGVRDTPAHDRDASSLLEREVGWHVPVDELRYWVRGLRAPTSTAQVTYDENGLPAVLEQAGWKVEYRDWFSKQSPVLPRKVFASHAKFRVRLVIEQWLTP
jgi:outer membrane lipoprotein LolB